MLSVYRVQMKKSSPKPGCFHREPLQSASTEKNCIQDSNQLRRHDSRRSSDPGEILKLTSESLSHNGIHGPQFSNSSQTLVFELNCRLYDTSRPGCEAQFRIASSLDTPVVPILPVSSRDRQGILGECSDEIRCLPGADPVSPDGCIYF